MEVSLFIARQLLRPQLYDILGVVELRWQLRISHRYVLSSEWSLAENSWEFSEEIELKRTFLLYSPA